MRCIVHFSHRVEEAMKLDKKLSSAGLDCTIAERTNSEIGVVPKPECRKPPRSFLRPSFAIAAGHPRHGDTGGVIAPGLSTFHTAVWSRDDAPLLGGTAAARHTSTSAESARRTLGKHIMSD